MRDEKLQDEFRNLISKYVLLVFGFVVVINLAFLKNPLNRYKYTLVVKVLFGVFVLLLFARALWKQNKSE